MRPLLARAAAATAVAAAVLVVAASPASADAAGPTDYRSEIVAVEPPTPAVELEMIGGDSFLRLAQREPVEVIVVGYRGEPYLRFDADGTVSRNERSPSRWLNDDRFGEAEVPPEATPDAEPEWTVVARDGDYAWHDHRTHWMNPSRPPGAEPGDTILEAVVPLVVDGDDVSVTVTSTLVASPGPWAAVIGAVLGAAVLAAAVVTLGLRRGAAGAVAATGVAAAVVGVWAFRSVPPETGPSAMLWLLPVVAVVGAVAAVATERWSTPAVPVSELLVGLAGAELVLWAWSRLDALGAAIIPSDAPPGLDRAVIAAAGVVGVVAVVAAVIAIVRPARAPEPAPAAG